jgi:hypothetical protein
VGSEVTAPRVVPVESVAQEVARWEAEPVVAPFQSRRAEAPPWAPSFAATPARGGAQDPRAALSGSSRRARAAAGAARGPVDTGVTTWGALPGEGVPPHAVEYEGVLPREEGYDDAVVVEDAPGWYEPGGSSELGRGGPARRVRPVRGRRLVPGVPRIPGGEQAPGGASELSRGGASELSF